MAKINKANAYVSVSDTIIGGSSEAIASGDLVSRVAGVAVKASSTSGKIIGLANGAKTFSVTNATGAADTLSYTDKARFLDVVINADATLSSPADLGKFYLINDTTQTADVATATTDSASTQLKLKKVLSAKIGGAAIFEIL
jgi:hypothetical protein